MLNKERIYLFDTTLRDGQQTPGIDFSIEDKFVIATMLDELELTILKGAILVLIRPTRNFLIEILLKMPVL